MGCVCVLPEIPKRPTALRISSTAVTCRPAAPHAPRSSTLRARRRHRRSTRHSRDTPEGSPLTLVLILILTLP